MVFIWLVFFFENKSNQKINPIYIFFIERESRIEKPRAEFFKKKREHTELELRKKILAIKFKEQINANIFEKLYEIYAIFGMWQNDPESHL